MDLSLSKNRIKLAKLNIFITGFLAFMLVASFGFDWGIAYGQTAGPTPSAGVAPAGQSSASFAALSVSITSDKTSLDINETATIVVKLTNTATARGRGATGNLEGFSLNNPNQAVGTVKDVNVVTTFPPSLKITSTSASQGSTTVNGQTVVANIGDIPPNTSATITYTVVALQRVTNLTIYASVSAFVDGKLVKLAVTTETQATAITGPGTAPSGDTRVIPGLPNTGAGNSANPASSQTPFETWKIVLLAGLFINLVVSLIILVKHRLSQNSKS